MELMTGQGTVPITKNDSFEKSFEKSSPLKKIIKIFRTQNVVKHHFQGGLNSRVSPRGTAKAFFKNSYNFQAGNIPNLSAYDRFARYSDYAEMETYPILAKALDIVADEVTQKNEDGKIIEVISEDAEIKGLLQDLFDNILHLNGKEMYKIVRNVCKYGDGFYFIDATEDNGVIGLIQMPANEVEREEGFDNDEPGAIRFKWTTRNNVQIPNAYVLHFRLDGNDLFYPYGMAFIEPARRPWRQLVLLEDAMMVYRITRAAERRVFFLDIAGIPPEDIDATMNKFNETIKKHKVVNEKGQIDLRFGAALSVEEDYIIPVRGSDSSTRIETLPGGQNIGDIEDIEFIRANLFGALGIPKAFLTFDQDIASKQVLTQEDIRFARTVGKIQEVIVNELVKVAMIHLFIRGYTGKRLVNFRIKMSNPSTVAELQKNELWRTRMDLVHSAGEGVFDTDFIYKNFLHLSDETIDTVRKGQIIDKLFQAKLLKLENSSGLLQSQGMGGAPLGGGFGGMGGDMGLGGDMGFGGDVGAPGMGISGQQGQFGGGEAMPGVGGFGEARDLSRYKDGTRNKENRGTDEIPGIGDESFDADPNDVQGIKRTITNPMGGRESVSSVLSDFEEILKEYRAHSRNTRFGIMKETICKEFGIFIGNVPASQRENLILEDLEKWKPLVSKNPSSNLHQELLKEVYDKQNVNLLKELSSLEEKSNNLLKETIEIE